MSQSPVLTPKRPKPFSLVIVAADLRVARGSDMRTSQPSVRPSLSTLKDLVVMMRHVRPRAATISPAARRDELLGVGEALPE